MIHAAGEDARFLAGGQSLVPMMNFRIVRPSALVDLSSCSDLAFVRLEEGKLRIGAMTRQYDVETDPLVLQHCSLLAEALSHAGPATIRNRATIGGSVANGYPVAELPTVAACLEAEMVLVNGKGERRVAARDFFVTGMVTAIEPGELLKEIVVSARGPRTRYGFAERGNHAGGEALAIVAACADVGTDGRVSRVSVAAAGLETVPVRLSNVEAALVGGGLSAKIGDAYEADLDASASGDTAERDLVKIVVEDAVAALGAS